MTACRARLDRTAAGREQPRQPAAAQVAHVGRQERDGAQVIAGLFAKAPLILEIGRNPVHQEVPAQVDRDRHDEHDPEPAQAHDLGQPGRQALALEMFARQRQGHDQRADHRDGDAQPDSREPETHRKRRRHHRRQENQPDRAAGGRRQRPPVGRVARCSGLLPREQPPALTSNQKQPGGHPDKSGRADHPEGRAPAAAVGARNATTSGVTTAPTAAPELKMPLPRLRSDGGRTRAVTRSAQGQLNDSPTPSKARQTSSIARLGTKAVATAASDHHATAAAYENRRSQRSTRYPAGTWKSA